MFNPISENSKLSRKRKQKHVSREPVVTKVGNKNRSNKLIFDLKSSLKPIYPQTPGQEELYDAIQQSSITICNGPAGTGKAQPLDAQILTPSGYKLMGDMKVGDWVCTPDGGTAQVLKLFPQGFIEVFKVTFSDETSTECSGDHLWYTETQLDRDAKRRGSVKLTSEIASTLITKNKKHNHSIPMVEPVEFESDSPLPIDPYVLGVMIGDGSLSSPTVGFTTADEEIAEAVGSNSLGVGIKKCKNTKYAYRITGDRWRVGSERPRKNLFKEAINALGLLGKKSPQKFIPEIYKFSSSETRLAILQGLMDTDGTIARGRNSCGVSFTSTSLQLANDVKFLVESLGGKAVMRSRITFYTYKGEKKAGLRSYTLHISMKTNPFRLKRKAEKFVPRYKYLPTRYITAIESTGIKECQCILIDHPDHLYITNNFIVTHNTLMTFSAAIQSRLHDKNIRKIVLIRPVIMSGDDQDIGFLPGDADQKMAPLLAPILKDSLSYILGNEDLSQEDFNLIVKDIVNRLNIEIIPLCYLRGRTLSNNFVILSESQNLTLSDFKLFITRIGLNSKVVIEGDSTQSDIGKDSGLLEFMMKMSTIEEIKQVVLDERDIVRNPLIAKILRKFPKDV